MLNPFPLETKQSFNVIKNSYCSKYEESLHKSKDVVEYDCPAMIVTFHCDTIVMFLTLL